MHSWALAHGATRDALCISVPWHMVQPGMHYASQGLGPGTWCNQGCIMHPWALAPGPWHIVQPEVHHACLGPGA